MLLARCRNVRGYLHCSSTAVHQPAGAHPLKETDPLGDNHRVMFATHLCSPIHSDDIVRQVPSLLEVASVPATVVNWAGEQASIEDWCGLIADLTGLDLAFEVTERTIGSATTDNTRMHS